MKLVVWLPCFAALACCAADTGYLGRDVCAGCHKTIAITQARTAMAQTWQGTATKQLPANYFETHAEGPDPAISYLVKRTPQGLGYGVQMPGRDRLEFPVEITMGGKRHGLSFLSRVPYIGGTRLPRAPLVETRYMHYAPENRLELSPGFPTDKPSSYETALGRVLSTEFERKCLTCHGEPRTRGTHTEIGVTCESCHGPGQSHLSALAKKTADKGIVNPSKLPIAEQMRPCSQCHSGFTVVQDPMPDDLLISDQVTALSNSECWRQSGGKVTCVNCHDPHQDAPRAITVAKSERTCLECHNEAVTEHAGLCPVNRSSGCVGCHMSGQVRAPFVITDHWIRVQSGQNITTVEDQAKWHSKLLPKRLYLRMIMVDDRKKAESIRQQLAGSVSFFDLARANSLDTSTAPEGGFLGDFDASQIDPAWSKTVLALQPGDISEVIEVRGKYLIFQRMPRNFREDAEARFNHAMDLRKEGKREQFSRELLEALKIYPHLLRALTYLGVTYAEAGNAQAGAGILNIATRLYPQDSGAHFNLAVAYGAMGSPDEIPEYERALEIQPDLVLAYLNLGAAYYAKGQYDEAVSVYQRGITENPLIASLHYSLSLTLEQENKTEEARDEMTLAVKIDPNVGRH